MGGSQRKGAESEVGVVCLGETMLMFAPPRFELMEHCNHFTAYSGGSESNVAIGLERLGLHAGWIGKLPDTPLGRKVVNGIRAYGVDTSAVVWSQHGRVGTFFIEWGAHPRPLRTIYDRAGSAAASLAPDELDWDYIAAAEWLHLTGITPALSETCRASSVEIVRRARDVGCKVSFDVNYRSLLWTVDQARAACREILPYVNVAIATESDALALFADELVSACSASEKGRVAHEVSARLLELFGLDAVVITLGSEGSVAYDGKQRLHSCGHRVQAVNRLGAGDAFDAGLLYGYTTLGLQAGLDYGSAMAAIKMTIPQNTPLVVREDVDRLLSGKGLEVVR